VTKHISGLTISTKQILLECQLLAAIEWIEFLYPLDIQSVYDEFDLRLTNIINKCFPTESKKYIFDTNSIAS